MVITHYNHADPTCAPAGGSVVVMIALADWNYANQWGTGGDLTNYRKNPAYNALKNAAADVMIDRAEAEIPGLRQSIKYRDVSTPLTNLRYTRNSSGSIYGSGSALDNTLTGGLRERTPIPNLLLTGAWVSNGGMSTVLVSGAGTALKACDLIAEGRRRKASAEKWTPPIPENRPSGLAELSQDEIAALLTQELAGLQVQF